MRRLLCFLIPLALLAAPTAAPAAEVPPGAVWSEATIEVPDGTKLHADILRPKGLPETARTPVILSIGPYFNHAGQTGALGPVQGTGYDPVGPSTGPNERFHDLILGGKLMERGYTWVQVDNRGFGGSSGCLDWAGPGEQADVVAAVEWAASQPWSSGKVGMYGKSYDGVTGIIGALAEPKGLAAVVSQEPVYDMYRYLYANGVRYVNSVGTPALYDAIAVTPGPLLDSPTYNVNGATDPACLATNYAAQQDSNKASEYWQARDFIARADGSDVPFFLTQGFLENNTKPDGTWDFFNALDGPKRAWIGMWDHVRGNDTDSDGRLLMGRPGWFDEVMRFFDHYVREVPLADAPTDRDPRVVVQTSDGSYRAEQAWPPQDATLFKTALRPGTYVDDSNNYGTGEGSGYGVWTVSPPLPHDAHYGGVAKATLELAGNAAANVVVNVYSISPDRQAMLLSRNTSLVRDGKVTLDLYGNDWKIPAGHRIGVLVSSSNSEWWLHVPTNTDVEVVGGSVELPFLRHQRTETIEGGPAVRLEEWLEDAPFEVSEAAIAESQSDDFALPPRMRPMPKGSPATPARPAKRGRRKGRLRARIAVDGRRVTVFGNAPQRSRVRVVLKRGRRTVARRTFRTKVTAYRVSFRVRRAGRYRAVVTARRADMTLRKRSGRVRVR